MDQDGLEEFTNKYSSNQIARKGEAEGEGREFNEISSMSFKD